MNAISWPAEIAQALIGQPFRADAMVAIEKAEDPLFTQKRHWPTALRQIGRYLDRPLSLISTRIAAIGPVVKRLHPSLGGEAQDLRQPPVKRQSGSPLVRRTDARPRAKNT